MRKNSHGLLVLLSQHNTDGTYLTGLCKLSKLTKVHNFGTTIRPGASMRKKVLAMKWKIFKNCGNKTFDSIELGRRLQETEGCHRSSCTSFTSVAWLKERRIFTQNVFLVYAQTILEVNEIFVQFHCLSSCRNDSKRPVPRQNISPLTRPAIKSIISFQLNIPPFLIAYNPIITSWRWNNWKMPRFYHLIIAVSHYSGQFPLAREFILCIATDTDNINLSEHVSIILQYVTQNTSCTQASCDFM